MASLGHLDDLLNAVYKQESGELSLSEVFTAPNPATTLGGTVSSVTVTTTGEPAFGGSTLGSLLNFQYKITAVSDANNTISVTTLNSVIPDTETFNVIGFNSTGILISGVNEDFLAADYAQGVSSIADQQMAILSPNPVPASLTETFTKAGSTTTAPITTGTLGLPVFRFFDKHDGGHFFTTSTAERDQVLATRNDMNFEGVGYSAVNPASADPNAAPVFRFFETTSGGHFFTTSAAERDQVIATRSDMNFEGVGYSEHTSQQMGDAPVYRFFETTSGGHFFTASTTERDTVMATRSDMRFEGVAFFAPT